MLQVVSWYLLYLSGYFYRVSAIVNFALSMTQGWRWLLMLGGFMLVSNYAERHGNANPEDKNKQYSSLWAIYIGPGIYFCAFNVYCIILSGQSGPELLNQAAIVTLALFTGLSAVVFVTKKDFSFIRTGSDHRVLYRYGTDCSWGTLWL